jgi:hypothetical protein
VPPSSVNCRRRYGTTLIEEVRFALDSPLEGDEFELMVPGLRDRQTLMGDGTAVVKTEADLSGNRRFESVSLQRGVCCELDRRGGDKTILRKWLKSGFLEKQVFYDTISGTPQGGVISPVLASSPATLESYWKRW